MIRNILIVTSFLMCLCCSEPMARKPINVKSGTNIQRSLSLNKKIKDRDEEMINNIIQRDTLHDYLNSGNGFWFYYTHKDSITANKPSFGDQVNFDYTLKQLNGKYIYKKDRFKNQEYRIDKQELFFGLREGLKLLQAGESATFLFPSHLAYGFYGDLEKIGHNIPLISEVTVNSISKN